MKQRSTALSLFIVLFASVWSPLAFSQASARSAVRVGVGEADLTTVPRRFLCLTLDAHECEATRADTPRAPEEIVNHLGIMLA